ncbi:MAG TPA: FkbM family methyltransferase [Solirubrobacteraceae bacterium]|jgi:FkbM family methyltransferase|nr:FkbM family methyltransferase [Solirubrobacteraceae bacterium]
MSAIRQGILEVARRTGLEPQLRAAQRTIGPREVRRNMRDDEAFRRLLALSLPSDAACVDVGANLGELLAHMVRYAPSGRHVAFEPLPELAARLRTRFPGVDVRQAAVGAERETRAFTRVRGIETRSGFEVGGYPPEQLEQLEVEVQTLDGDLPEGFVPALIKIDVEGAELEVLRGGAGTLTAHTPTVAFEHDNRADSAAIYDLLAVDVGLRIFDFDGDGPLTAADFQRKVERRSHWNFVAHR